MVEIFNNIRKVHQFIRPCEELADYIEFFSESVKQETLDPGFERVKMFPSYTPTFWINLGKPYYLSVNNKMHLIKETHDILVLRNCAVEKFKSPDDHIFTVKFFPGGLETILGINQIQFINQVVNLNKILPPSFLQKIKQSACFEQRMLMMQDFLLSRYKNRKKQDHYLQFVQDCIEKYDVSNLQLSTGEMAEKMFVTSKTINRYFNKVVGVSPKSYFSIMRTRTALTGYVNKKDEFIPFDYGYYDMSHFYKDVIKFTGQKLIEHSL